MKPLDSNQSQEMEQQDGEQLSSEEESSVQQGFEIAANILLSEQSVNALLQALQGGGNPSSIIGAHVGQLLLKVIPKTKKDGPSIADRAWMARGGIADQLIDEAGNLYTQMTKEEFTEEMEQEAYQEVLDLIKSAHQSGAGMNEEAPPQQAPVAPQMAQGMATGGMQ